MLTTLIIKGDAPAVTLALSANGYKPVALFPHPKFRECVVHVDSATVRWELLADWLHDPSVRAPFPDGTLLWFGPYAPQAAIEAAAFS